MPSLNKAVFIGRLTRDPETRQTQKGDSVTSFSIAVDRRFKDTATGERKTDFFRCTAWRQTAEFVQQYVQKGRLVAVTGSVEINEYTDRDGARRTSVDVQCEMVEVLEWPKDGEAQGAPQAPPPAQPPRRTEPPRPAPPPKPVMLDDDDSDPFASE